MRRSEREIKDIDEIEQILKTAKVCRISMVEDGKPYLVPLNFGYQDKAIYVHSAKSGRKIEILKKNNNVCFEVDIDSVIVEGERACDYSARYKSVIGFGKAIFIEEEAQKMKALDILMGQYVKDGPATHVYSQKDVERIEVIKIAIDEMTGKKSG
ncbi:MAG: pyridoxamine 5'-phosphate oxidase family protein [Vallitaleaceae bacterium]|nr:pyridoxamine 5'-phosphate oxidase family protein [Vallitaleaceae bacterium]